MAPHRNLQRKLLLVKLSQNSRRRRKEMQQKILFLLTVRRMLLLEVFFFLLFLFLPRKPLLIDHVDGFPVTRDGSKKYGTHTLIRGSRKRFVYQKPPLIHATCAFSTISERTKTLTYANVYRNTINDGDSQTSPLPIFPEGGGTSVHRLVRLVISLDAVVHLADYQ